MNHFSSYEAHLLWVEDLTKNVLAHAPPAGPANDSFRADLAGLLSTSYVAAFECCVKAIFNSFAQSKKNKILVSITEHNFAQINSKIHYDAIGSLYIRPYGVSYHKEFVRLIAEKEEELLKNRKLSMKTTYANLLKWRHAFAHEGKKLATLEEVAESYSVAKEVIFITDNALSA